MPRSLKLKEQTGRNRWLDLSHSGRNAKSELTVSDESTFIDVYLTNRQLRSLRYWINKQLGEGRIYGPTENWE